MPICPDCNGEKTLSVLFARMCSRSNKPMPQSMPCPACEGAGEVTEQFLEWRRRGRAYRNKRLAAGEGLRRHAERIGIRPSRLSQIEQGKSDPSEIGA